MGPRIAVCRSGREVPWGLDTVLGRTVGAGYRTIKTVKVLECQITMGNQSETKPQHRGLPALVSTVLFAGLLSVLGCVGGVGYIVCFPCTRLVPTIYLPRAADGYQAAAPRKPTTATTNGFNIIVASKTNNHIYIYPRLPCLL